MVSRSGQSELSRVRYTAFCALDSSDCAVSLCEGAESQSDLLPSPSAVRTGKSKGTESHGPSEAVIKTALAHIKLDVYHARNYGITSSS